MRTLQHTALAVPLGALVAAPLFLASPAHAQSVPAASAVAISDAGFTVSATELDTRLIRHLESEDHTTVTPDIAIGHLSPTNPDASVRPNHPWQTRTKWRISDPDSAADRVRLCVTTREFDARTCTTSQLTTGGRAKSTTGVRKTAQGWAVTQPVSLQLTARQCRTLHGKPAHITATITATDTATGTRSSESMSWKVRCAR